MKAIATAMLVAVCSTASAQDALQWSVSDGGNGHWYKGVVLGASPVSWQEARSAAHAAGAELAQLKTQQALAWVFTNVASAPQLWRWKIGPWLGGYQTTGSVEPAGGWRWIDGTPIGLGNWEVGEPADFLPCGDHEDFLNLYCSQGCTAYPIPSPVPRYNDMPRSGLCDCCGNLAGGIWVSSAVFEWSADCNGDGVVDYGQITSGQFADVNADGVLDICQRIDRLVPSQYPTIQAAVNASNDGDTIRISPGVYNERVVMDGRAVALRGDVGKAAQTVINAASSDGGAVDISNISSPSLLGLSDLTLTHSSVSGISRPGLRYAGSLKAPLVVERCIMRNNYSTNDNAGGAYLLGRVEFRDCAFIDNRTGNHGSAVYAYDNCPVSLVRCSLRDHTTGSGMFYARNSATITVSNCVIRNANVLCSGTTGTTTFTNNLGCLVGTVGGSGFVNGGGNNWSSCPDCDGDGQTDLEELIYGAADCNGNGIPDACDVSSGIATDFNGNGVLDQCECPPDIDSNGVVDGSDLAIVLGSWGPAQPGSAADVVRDGQVNGADLALLLANWGPCR